MSTPKMSPGKLHLSLRTTPLQKEIAQKKYPKDLALCLQRFEQRDRNAAGEMYDQILDFVNLQERFGQFWKQSNCASLVEWLSRRNMPSGTTLANREILVRLFDRETFIEVRDEALGYMTFEVSKVQADSEMRRRDYQAIFGAYLKSNDVFDRVEFRKIVNWHVNTTYKPEGRDPKDNTARPPRSEPRGTTSHRVARPVESESLAEELPTDYVVETRPCSCGWQAWAIELEAFIRTEMGARRLPKRPAGLR